MASQALTDPRGNPSPRTQSFARGLPSPALSPALRIRLPALATAGLLWLSYFPVAWGWLGWVALVPLLGLVRCTARSRTVYLSAWLGGLVFYWPVLQWLRVADERMYFTWAFLATYCSLYFPLVLFLVRRLERRTALPLVFTVPVVWTALEFFRATFGTGFSWYLLGHTQHDFLPVIQIADLAGAYGVSFLVVAVNAFLAECLLTRRWFRTWCMAPEPTPPQRRISLAMQGGLVTLVLAAALGYGTWRLSQDAFTPGPRIALIQGNVPQQIRNNPFAADTLAAHYISLCDLAARYKPNLLVWPETSYPQDWQEVEAGVPPEKAADPWPDRARESRELARDVGRRWQTPVLLGLNALVLEKAGAERRYNSALLIEPDGTTAGRYDKIHRVPLGEYVPLRDWLPFMNSLAPYDFDYSVSPGRSATRFALAKTTAAPRSTFGVVICYEDTDPAVSRLYGGGDGRPAADFVLNTSNDGWFNGTSEHNEHLANCRFRAVECRRSVARAVNMGISAVVDGNGRVLRPERVGRPDWAEWYRFPQFPAETVFQGQRPEVWEIPRDVTRVGELPLSRWGEYKKVPGVLLASIPIDHRVSLYSFVGDWLPWACWVALAGALVSPLVWRWEHQQPGPSVA